MVGHPRGLLGQFYAAASCDWRGQRMERLRRGGSAGHYVGSEKRPPPFGAQGEQKAAATFVALKARSIDRLLMALENCSLCRGTGWKMVARADRAGSHAVACDCGMEERAGRVMERARVPKRYEHCDFESYVTDLADGKTWTAQHSQSLKNAKVLTQGFVREYPGSAEKGLLLMGPSGVGKTHLAVASLKELIHRGHAGLFCDYRELMKEIQASYNQASESTEIKILEPIRTIESLVM